MLGLQDGIVRLVEHQPGWAALFEAEKIRLEACLGELILDVQHIGSTSIPGLPAKPILDIAVAVQNFETAAVCVPLLELLGYQHRGEYGIPRRRYFIKGQPRTHHLHMLEIDSQQWQSHLLFRDSLRRNPALAAEFASFKRQIASHYQQNRAAYQAAKDAYVSRLLALILNIQPLSSEPQ